MLDRFDHHELLALIEGELDAPAAATLRRRLAGEPRGEAVLALVDRISQDRSAMRSVPDPELPREVAMQLETLLARPMLMEPVEAAPTMATAHASKPGEFRRQHRRRMWRIRWPRLALAAMVFMAMIAGIWAGVEALMRMGGSADRGMLAMNESQPNPASAALDVEIAPQGTMHHYSPLASAKKTAPVAAEERRPSAVPSKPIVADFAIVIRGADVAVAEAALRADSEQPDAPIALVRNFSFAEAQRIAEEWRLAQGGRDERRQSPAVASAGSAARQDQLQSLAEQVRQRLNGSLPRAVGSPSPGESSGQLSGPKENAPTLEQQLDFSSRGATHTIAVPAAELPALLEQLSLHEGQIAALRMMPKSSDDQSNWQPLSAWLSEGPQVRQSFDKLAQFPPNTIVLVPVIVESTKK